MKLTSRGRYAVTAMLDMALRDPEERITLNEISQRQDISLSYLEQIFARLRKGGLVTSMRGPGGGYRLARPPAEISVADIIHAVDEVLDARYCNGGRDCHNGSECLSHQLWNDLSEKIESYLHGITLQGLIDQRRAGAAQTAEIKFEREVV
ncbi:transcriptional regulator, BadM/Rrf2 family [Sulfurivirga caldicuralii]|uniref:Transcriptional regulator, BadM/Rrf2 family n=1 Tax=Sulfurivirga caldicuralii TaxID=364032 RepID=A0A1N6G7R5_9GAMM|nr:Rrf2 family transcriptional regulator [Sulfurivirga caldicuralii]SIO03586.1 transcriptional regulator, BadM/Rrf2 family [Sulfurivirga caldicuralii]